MSVYPKTPADYDAEFHRRVLVALGMVCLTVVTGIGIDRGVDLAKEQARYTPPPARVIYMPPDGAITFSGK